jgi:hypothetical protein
MMDKLVPETIKKIDDMLADLGSVEKTLKELLGKEWLLETEGIMFAGLTIENIIDLKREYLARGGKEPITSESIREVFRSDMTTSQHESLKIVVNKRPLCGTDFFDVHLFKPYIFQSMIFSCKSEHDANDFVAKLRYLLTRHTNEVVNKCPITAL